MLPPRTPRHPQGQNGRHRQRNDLRGNQGNDNRQRHTAEQEPYGPRQKNQRQKYDAGGEGGKAHQRQNVMNPLQGTRSPGFGIFLMEAVNAALDDDDGMVHQRANGCGNPSQGHDIDAKAEGMQGQQRGRQRKWHDRQGRQGRVQAPEKKQYHQKSEGGAQRQCNPDIPQTGMDQMTQVIDRNQMHLCWEMLCELP